MYQMTELKNLDSHKFAVRAAKTAGLLDSGWLSGRTAAFQQELLSYAIRKTLRAGEPVYHHGDPADGLYAVLSGAVKVTTPADDGQEFVAHRDETGFWIGDLAMLSDETRLVTVSVTCDTEMLFVPATRILEMLDREPKYYREFYALSHENMRTALRILANLAVTGAERRLVLRLLHLDDTLAQSGGWISMSHADLAEMVAISLPTLQRSLRNLTDRNLVELGYGRLRILNKGALLNHCQS